MNQVNLIGRLGQEVDLKYTQNGKAVASISMATSEKRSGQEKTEWHKVIVWEKLAELCNQYLTKGSQILVTGKLQTRSFTDQNNIKKYTTEVIAQNIEFLSPKNENKQQPQQTQQQYQPQQQQQFNTDDIPF